MSVTADVNLTVAFCCNDSHGMFTGRVVEIGIEDEMRLEAPSERGLLLKRDGNFVKVGRKTFSCTGTWQEWIGNIYWDATGMAVDSVRDLVSYLLGYGWTVVEHACEGPLADLVRHG